MMEKWANRRPLTEKNDEHVTTYENSVKLQMARVADEAASEPTTEPESQSPREDGQMDKLIDDFRPTDPGHSPGAGHGQPSPKEDPRP
ncbi:precursor of CEP5-like [Senna tora]|uniref:Precursor of CEP5-like n=1 Tax=Senna tora TaxID=362788 RepID=A0A834TW84_9FABA|nr:precursor of CEP5-like [Senna tora]